MKERNDAVTAREETKRALADGGIAPPGRGGERLLVQAFLSPDPSQDGRDVKVADVLDRTCEALDREFAGPQATKGGCSMCWATPTMALAYMRTAADLHRRAWTVRDPAPDHADTLTSRDHLGNDYWCAGRFSEAAALMRRR